MQNACIACRKRWGGERCNCPIGPGLAVLLGEDYGYEVPCLHGSARVASLCSLQLPLQLLRLCAALRRLLQRGAIRARLAHNRRGLLLCARICSQCQHVQAPSHPSSEAQKLRKYMHLYIMPLFIHYIHGSGRVVWRRQKALTAGTLRRESLTVKVRGCSTAPRRRLEQTSTNLLAVAC